MAASQNDSTGAMDQLQYGATRKASSCGVLDGLTVMRYAHIYRDRTSGGMEQYLSHLNSGLLNRNQMTILQMYLATDPHLKPTVEVERIGRGLLVWVPVTHLHEPRSPRSLLRRIRLLSAHRRSPGEGRLHVASAVRHLRHRGMVLSDSLVGVLSEFGVDLVLFHWLSYDIGPLIHHCNRSQVPYAVVNHFDNRRLSLRRNRRWLAGAARLAGVSTQNLPAGMEDRFVNLSDAVDLDYYAPENARWIDRPPGQVVLLPSRIAEGKGHRDLLEAASRLRCAGIDIVLVFAGAIEVGADRLQAQLEEDVTTLGLTGCVSFVGQLPRSALRDWYAASEIVALPSYFEGLGRVLLEAQAMKTPVVAYSSGGIRDAVRDGVTGFLATTGDRDGLTEKLRCLLQSPETRQRMGAAGRMFVADRFSPDSLLSQHEEFYREIGTLTHGRMSNVTDAARVLPKR